jgi:hypothetical protein
MVQLTIDHIVSDPERFGLVRKMWDLMLTGTYNPAQICEIANNDWGLRTRPRGKFIPKRLTYSHMYQMFTNIFYAGYLNYNGNQYKAAHEPMITIEEFDRVQKLLGDRGKPRSQTKEFPYTGIIHCAECGCTITAESKQKLIKSTGENKIYTYYHCTHRKRDYRCTQRKNKAVEKLEQEILDDLDITQVFPEFYKFAVVRLKNENTLKFEEKEKANASWLRIINQCEEKLQRLLDTKIEGLINSDEYLAKKEVIIREKTLAH